MSYDNLDDGEFAGTNSSSVEYDDCIYIGFPLDKDEIGHGNLIYRENGKFFSGECVKGKPKNGFFNHTFRNEHSDAVTLICEFKNFLPYEGELINKAGGIETYKNGKKIGQVKNMLHTALVGATAGGALLAAVVLNQANTPNTANPSEVLPMSANTTTNDTHITGTDIQKTQMEPAHDEYKPEGLTEEEIFQRYGDLTQACTPEEELKLKAALEWLDKNVGRVDAVADQLWKYPENIGMQRVISSQASFPDRYQFNIEKIYHSSSDYRFICPGESERYLGLSNFDEAGNLAIYEGSFKDPCTTVNTVLHEALHKNTDWGHPYASKFNQFDWVYYAGDIAEGLCREERKQEGGGNP